MERKNIFYVCFWEACVDLSLVHVRAARSLLLCCIFLIEHEHMIVPSIHHCTYMPNEKGHVALSLGWTCLLLFVLTQWLQITQSHTLTLTRFSIKELGIKFKARTLAVAKTLGLFGIISFLSMLLFVLQIWSLRRLFCTLLLVVGSSEWRPSSCSSPERDRHWYFPTEMEQLRLHWHRLVDTVRCSSYSHSEYFITAECFYTPWVGKLMA